MAEASRIWGVLFLLMAWCSSGIAQPPPPPSGPIDAILTVQVSEVEVGRPFRVGLEVHHPADMVVIFPDTTGDFFPFELVKRFPVPTRTDESGSIDFSEYDLFTWSIDSVQYLRLPVRYIEKGDTLLTFSNTEPLQFLPKIITPIDSLQVMPNTDLAPIFEPTNWTAIIVISLGLLLLIALALLLLSGPIRKALRRARIEREWKKYSGKLHKVPALLPNQENYLLELSKVWKSYFDRGWERGLGSLSTKELRAVLPRMDQLEQTDQKQLLELNQNADRVVYAGSPLAENQLQAYFQQVSRIMEQEYKRRKEAVEL